MLKFLKLLDLFTVVVVALFTIGIGRSYLNSASADTGARPVHWTCSNEQDVLYMTVDVAIGEFTLYTDKGAFIGTSRFTKQTADNGAEFFYGELKNQVHGTVGIAIKGAADGKLALAVIDGESAKPVEMECE